MKRLFWAYIKTSAGDASYRKLVDKRNATPENFYNWLKEKEEEDNGVVINCGII